MTFFSVECQHDSANLTSCSESWTTALSLIYLIENTDKTFQRLPNLESLRDPAVWSQYGSKPSTAVPLLELREQM